MRDQTTWNKIRPGDIISFRYPTKGVLKLNTLLVFAIKAPVQTKSGSKKHLRGMKIEAGLLSHQLGLEKLLKLEIYHL